ncbi:Type IV pilus biogenesis factor PilY1 [Xylophilus ampelinus]|nr:Type IV pilus biogenesis factor PilY1 [Xylophilus ampelinus]
MKRFGGWVALALMAAGLCMGLAAAERALAAQTELSNVPLGGASQSLPKPNVMLLMDTSKSMAFTHMPDEVEFPNGTDNALYELPIGYRSAQCNALYYNPKRVYELPRDGSGALQPNPLNFGSVRYNFYDASDLSTTDLSTSFRAYDRNTRVVSLANVAEDRAQPAYYYVYEGSASTTYNAAPCTDMEGALFAGQDLTQSVLTASTAGGLWRRKLVTSTSGTGAAGLDERRNFAIWYTYYRTRMAMLKSSISLAFYPVADNFRVGLVSMNPLVNPTQSDSGVDPAKYLAINDFTTNQKSAWYGKLFSQVPDGSSPAREGLARVGRHFGGRADGINSNMLPDPVQQSCQQNFTIMTTDGYWNTAQETVGPVKLDGTTRVGNQDGMLTPATLLDRNDPTQYSHRPMWDGSTTGRRTDTITSEMFRREACDSGEFYRTTSVVFQSTSQPTRRTQSLTRTTQQVFASTSQTSQSTTQEQKTTSTETREVQQTLASTQQQTRSTRQELITHEWWGRGTIKAFATTTQQLQTTTYMEKTVAQIQQRTRTQTMTQVRKWRTQEQTTRTSSRTERSKQQLQMTQTLTRRSTTQPLITRSYTMLSTRQERESTRQILAYNGTTESATPVASCTNTSEISCITLTTVNVPVAACTPQTPDASNGYMTRTCDAVITGPVAVAACTPSSASAANNYVASTCATNVVGPQPAANCSAAGPSLSNGFATVTCSANTTGPTPVAPASSCVAGTDANFVTTTCDTTSTVTAVGACTAGTAPGTNVVTTCATVTTQAATGVAACTAEAASNANNYTETLCTPATASDYTPEAGCASATASASNNWTTTSCSHATLSGPTAVEACTESNGTAPTFIATRCTTETVAPTTNVASCTDVAASAANNFVATQCGGAAWSNWSNASSCSAQAPDAGNGFLQRECQEQVTWGPTPVMPSQCSAGTTSNGVKTTCVQQTFTDQPVSSCVPSTAGPSFVSCNTVTTPEVQVASCAQGGGANTNWVITSCRYENSGETAVQSCNPQNAGPGNGNVQTYCNFHSVTEATPPGSCTPQTADATNGWVTIKCPAAQVTGPTGVPLNSCTSVEASATNAWVATTCAMNGPTPPTPVQSCASGTGADFTVTTCTDGPNRSPATPVVPGSCTPQTASAANGWTAVLCTPNTTTVGVAAGTCSAQAANPANGFTQVACNTVTTGPTFVPTGSCTAGTSADFTTTACNTVTTGPTLVASCTAGVDGEFKSTTCSYNTVGPVQLAPGTACNNEAAGSGNNFTSTTCTTTDTTVGVAEGSCVPSPAGVFPVVTCGTVTTGPTPVASCTPGTSGTFVSTTCSTSAEGPDRVSSCSAVTPSASNGWSSTTCVPIPGLLNQRRTRTTTITYDVSGDTPVEASGQTSADVISNWENASACVASPALPPAVDVSGSWSAPSIVKGPVTGAGAAGSVDSLADVAQYYYTTDLRNALTNDVPSMGSDQIEADRAPWQHMTTFVVGLGVSGTVNYQGDYKSAITGDFARIRSYTGSPPYNWPVWPTGTNLAPAQYNDPRSIDDFWHAAVNGRGKYFSASDPQSVVAGLQEALAGIQAQAGAGGGVSTTSQSPIAGDNQAFTASFTTQKWTGNVIAREVDLGTGLLSSAVKWSAQTLLDAKVGTQCDNRKIYARNPATNALVDFAWDTRACDGAGQPTGAAGTGLTAAMQANFQGTVVTTGLSQYATMTDGSGGSVDQRNLAAGKELVNFLRGQRAREGYVTNSQMLYRARDHVLGDIVNSQPTYVKGPSQLYADQGYAAFAAAHKSRTPMVYVGANDGMLHAFYAPNNASDPNDAMAGQEAWAFVPQAVMPHMWRLADVNYVNQHRYFVDGRPVAGDVYVGGAWKTMLVGGLRGGGKSFYALDVTDPTAPQAMWEFSATDTCVANPIGATSDCNLGMSFGEPIITKLANGTWVVLLTSGYNNSDGGADGRGYLYVLNAANGQIMQRIGTGVGSTGTPSGLREINIYASNYVYNNTAQRVYGGDLLGNIWRFDINDAIPPAGNGASRLATAKDVAGSPQPITTRPVLAEVNNTTMLMVGTGRLLGASDLSDTSAQTVYAFKDPLGSTEPLYSNMRTQLKPLKMTQTGSGASATRTVECASTNVADCASTAGWFIDLPESGERMNVDMRVVQGTLAFVTNVPSDSMCAGGGHAWLNYVDLITGEPVPSSADGVTSVVLFSNSLAAGLDVVVLPSGTVKGIGQSVDTQIGTKDIPVGSPAPLGKRISWREIVR